jgi:ABC-type spermidine/putrescine transport system permease subunit II
MMNANVLKTLMSFLPLLIPVVVLELGLMIFALIDLIRRERTKGPKWLWAIIIVCINLIGPVVYLLVGREE